VIAAEIGVDALVKFAVAGITHVERLVAAVIFPGAFALMMSASMVTPR